MNAELKLKLARVRALLKEQNAPAALIGLQSNFSWLACGGEAHVPLNTDRSFGQLVVTPKDFFVFANRIEMDSLQQEVLPGLDAKPLLWEWANPAGGKKVLRKIADPRKILSDCGDWGTKARPGLIHPLHYSLVREEINRFRTLGKLTASAVEETCRQLQPGQTEFTIAGQLCQAAWNRNLTPVVVLVAVNDRIRKFRHPRPTKARLKRHAMLVLCARQAGLIVAMTRIVHFGKLPDDLRRRHEAVCHVDTAFQLNTQPGRKVAEVFREGVEAYDAHGFKDEWKLHHQGGPCGYQGRDYLGSFDAPGEVLENQPFAWNPSITGTKSEDTILATKNGPEVITQARDWPQVTVQFGNRAWQRPDILVR